MGTRSERRRAALVIARRYGVPFRVAARAVAHVAAGRATPALAAELGDLGPHVPKFPPLEQLIHKFHHQTPLDCPSARPCGAGRWWS
jgi:hypothetical protein